MPENDKEIASTFLEAWAPEFAKSVEMFTGRQSRWNTAILREWKPEHNVAGGSVDLWQSRHSSAGITGSVWIGTPKRDVPGLDGIFGGRRREPRALYRELLRQSLEGAAHCPQSGPSQRIVCESAAKTVSSARSGARSKRSGSVRPDQERAIRCFRWDFDGLMLAVDHDLL